MQVLKNTVSGFDLTLDPANIPSSQLCESVKNGEIAAGVSVVECPKISPDNSLSSSQEFRCVHYSGTLDMSLTLDLGSTSGESNFLFKIHVNFLDLLDFFKDEWLFEIKNNH